ncbi:MAG: hypothetical protein HYS87_02800 [Candidatus Colwellbacteria bacterium]|nr:hypothetical protein [Candidatus Colwellbacteria bacterium]
MNNNGYIALTSVILISALTITIVLAVSWRGYVGQGNVQESYYKEISASAAKACANTAILRLSENPLYAGNETINIGQDSCTILPIEDIIEIPPKKAIKATSTVLEAVTNLYVVIENITLSLVSWEEVESF